MLFRECFVNMLFWNYCFCRFNFALYRRKYFSVFNFFFNLDEHRGIDSAISNNEIPLVAKKLPPLLKQVTYAPLNVTFLFRFYPFVFLLFCLFLKLRALLFLNWLALFVVFMLLHGPKQNQCHKTMGGLSQ